MEEWTDEKRIALAKRMTDAHWHGYTGQPLNLVHFQTWKPYEHEAYQQGREQWIREGMR